MAARDIRALPKLEGTVHVNIALIIKFMPNFFFNPESYPEIPRRDDAADDSYLFSQVATRGLGQIRFHDYGPIFDEFDLPNAGVFREQVAAFRELLEKATPGDNQANDIDFLMAVGELFALVVYAQLFLENAKIYEIGDDLIGQVFDVFIRDLSAFAVDLHGKPSSTEAQQDFCLQMIRKPVVDVDRTSRVWESEVLPLGSAYEMND